MLAQSMSRDHLVDTSINHDSVQYLWIFTVIYGMIALALCGEPTYMYRI